MEHLATFRGEPVDPLDLPTTAHIEVAVRMACQALKVEPSAVLGVPRNSRARTYAYEALHRCFRKAPRFYIAALLGAPPRASCITYLRTAHEKPWYCEKLAARIRMAVLAVPRAGMAEASLHSGVAAPESHGPMTESAAP